MRNPLPISQFTRAFQPRKTLEAQNAWYLYVEVFWWGILFGIAQAFLPVFTIRLGGTDTHVGLLSALPALVITLFSIPGSRLVERETKPLSVLLISVAFVRIGYLAIGIVPLLLLSNRADFVVLLFGVLSIGTAIATVAFTVMFGRAVRPEIRPHVVSTRNVLVGIAGTGIAYLGGLFLELVLFPYNYAILFGLGFIASMIGLYYLSRIRLVAADESRKTSAEATPRGAREFITMLRSQSAFTRFSISQFIFHWGVFFAVPLYSIYWVRNLNASESWIGLYRMVESATTIIAFPIWARFTARRGNRLVLVVSSAGMLLYNIFTPFIPSVEWLLPLSVWGGAFSSGFALALFNELLRVSPEQNRPAFIAAFTATINFAAFVSPLVSTSLIPFFGIHAILFLGAAFRLLGVIFIWKNLSVQTTG